MDRAAVARLCKRTALVLAVAAGALGPAVAPADITYTYDTIGRVTSATYPSGTTIVYSYDNAGNKIQQTVASSTSAPPVAVDDYISTPKNTLIKYPVLSNDYTPNSGYSLVLDIGSGKYTQGGYGSVFPDGGPVQMYYQPNPGYTGTDTYTYTVSDQHGGEAVATVHVTVTP